jgi:hypothetical protein
MHLSPAALEDAIRLLDGDGQGTNRGEIVESGGSGVPTPADTRQFEQKSRRREESLLEV